MKALSHVSLSHDFSVEVPIEVKTCKITRSSPTLNRAFGKKAILLKARAENSAHLLSFQEAMASKLGPWMFRSGAGALRTVAKQQKRAFQECMAQRSASLMVVCISLDHLSENVILIAAASRHA